MKKLFKGVLILLICSTIAVSCKAQTNAYISPGVTLSSTQLTETVEVGLTDNTNIFALVLDTYDNGSREWYGGFKFYRKAFKAGPSNTFYGFGAVKAHLQDKVDLVFEPGLALLTNLGKNFNIRTSLSSPIYENTVLFKPTALSAGVALSWIIR